MISATPQPAFDELTNQLAAMAEALAVAKAQSLQLAQGTQPSHWRQASLVWPLFSANPMKKG